VIVRTGEREPETAWLSALLDAEAESYTPDSTRLSASVYERLACVRARRTRAFTVPIRLSGIPVGVAAAALCATVAMAVTASVGTGPPVPGSSPAPSPSPSPVPDPTATPPPPRSPGPTASAGLGIGTSPSGPAVSAPATRTITAAGEVDGRDNAAWSQEKVLVSLTVPATSFELTVAVAMGPGVASAGSWTTFSPTLVDVSVRTQADGIGYVFRLKPGQVLPAGDALFAVQFTHDASHDPAADTYSLTSTSNTVPPNTAPSNTVPTNTVPSNTASPNTDQAHGGTSTTLRGTF
jgi:hypothetical protein